MQFLHRVTPASEGRDAETHRDAARLEKQIARATKALANVEAGYYVTDEEFDSNPTASKVQRQPIKAKWV